MSRTVSFYQQVCDNPNAIVATVTNSANLEAEARLIIEEAQEQVNLYRTKLQKLLKLKSIKQRVRIY